MATLGKNNVSSGSENETVFADSDAFNASQNQRGILEDIYGKSCGVASVAEGETMLSRAREKLQEAIQMLPNDEKRKAYDQAMQQCPQLVERESNPDRFLRAHEYDPWATASRLAVYWQMRQEIFKERAFLPMNLTGEGTMAPQDVEAFRCGGTAILPPDSSGRPVVVADKSRRCASCNTVDTMLKVWFYVSQCLFENDTVLNKGWVFLMLMDDSKEGAHVKNQPMKKLWSFGVSQPIPHHARVLHLVVFRKNRVMETVAPFWLGLLERWKYLKLRTLLHYAQKKTLVWSENLKQYGIQRERTPQSMGGTLNLDEYFSSWCEERLQTEVGRALSLPISGEDKLDSLDQKPRAKPRAIDGQRPPEEPQVACRSASESVPSPTPLVQMEREARQARMEQARERKRKWDREYQRNKIAKQNLQIKEFREHTE